MTPLRHALRWLAPFHALWVRERADHAVTTAELAGLKAHFALAVDQRDRARDLAVALVDASEWCESDEALLADGFEAWGGGPA